MDGFWKFSILICDFFFFFDSHEDWEVYQIRMLCVDIACDDTA